MRDDSTEPYDEVDAMMRRLDEALTDSLRDVDVERRLAELKAWMAVTSCHTVSMREFLTGAT
jgi:hypothetical protein